jgi:carbamoyl-phosphate synthase large subunit
VIEPLPNGPPGGGGDRPTVLVLGVGSNVSQGILKALALGSLPCRVVAACVTPFAVGLYRADRAYVSPYAAEPGFVDWVLDVCTREGVVAVMSGVEPVLAALAPAAERIRREAGAVCIVSSPEVLAIGQDKLATCRWLAQHGFPHPRFAPAHDRSALAALAAACGYPLIAKPRDGRGGRGVVEIADDAQLELLAGRDDVVVQEALGDSGDEYTIGCFCDAEGALRGSIAMRRKLADGMTVRAEAGDFPEVRAVSERAVAELRPLGPCNVQLRTVRGRPVPFELNVRFSGTTAIRARFGFNDVEAALRQIALGEPPRDLPRPTHGTVLRYWNEIYLPAGAIGTLERDDGAGDGQGGRALIEDWGVDRPGAR